MNQLNVVMLEQVKVKHFVNVNPVYLDVFNYYAYMFIHIRSTQTKSEHRQYVHIHSNIYLFQQQFESFTDQKIGGLKN